MSRTPGLVSYPPIPGHAPSEPEGPSEPLPSSLELKESSSKKKKNRKKNKHYRQTPKDIRDDYLYDIHPEIRRAELDDGYVEFTKHFQYLGSFYHTT